MTALIQTCSILVSAQTVPHMGHLIDILISVKSVHLTVTINWCGRFLAGSKIQLACNLN